MSNGDLFDIGADIGDFGAVDTTSLLQSFPGGFNFSPAPQLPPGFSGFGDPSGFIGPLIPPGLNQGGPQGLNAAQQIAAALGIGTLGLGTAGFIESLLGGGTRTTPQMGVPQRALLNQLLATLQGQAPTQQGLFNQGAGILQSIAAGGPLPAGLSRTVEQAFQPAFGDVATQAIESARRRGFAGGAELLQGGPAGAIAGPALSNLQGQMAQSKLNILPFLVNALMAPGQAGISNLQNAFSGIPTGTRQQPSILGSLQGLGPTLQGAGQVLGAIPALGQLNFPSFF